MRRSPAVTLLVVLTVLPVGLIAQQANQTVTPPTRDPQAFTVLQRAFAAMGNALPADSVAMGTITIVAGTQTETGTIRIQTRGTDQSMEDINTDLTHRKVVYSHFAASETKGSVSKKMSLQLALTSQPLDFSLPLLSAALNQPDISLQYVGGETIDGSAVLHIRAINTFASLSTLQVASKYTQKDIWVDAGSSLVRKISFTTQAMEGRSVPHVLLEVEYSEYRAVGGVMYPFEVKKSLNGTPWTTISIQSVSFNNGLTDTDFQVN
jgi:hypothetical protein